MLITNRHKALYEQYYRNKPSKPSVNHRLPQILAFAEKIKARSILDYGCGGYASIEGNCNLRVQSYDPAVPAYSGSPRPADLVVCLDVLEHVEPNCIEDVIANLRRLAGKGIFLSVSCEPSTKQLPDGSPWHIFVKPEAYWRERFKDFDALEFDAARNQLTGLKAC